MSRISLILIELFFLMALVAPAGAQQRDLIWAKGAQPADIQLSWSADGSTIVATTEYSGFLRLWDARSGLLRRAVPIESGRSIITHAISGDGRYFAIGERNLVNYSTQFTMWDIVANTRLYSRTIDTGVITLLPDWISAFAFSPDGSLVAVATRDSVLRLFDVISGAERRNFGASFGGVYRQMQFSAGGDSLIAMRADAVDVIDLRSGSRLATTPLDTLGRYRLSPDGSRIVTFSSGDFTVIARESGAVLGGGSVTMPSSQVYDARLTADNRFVVLAHGIAGATMWDAVTGALVRSFYPGHDYIASALPSPDGTMLVTGGQLGDFRMWNIATGDTIWHVGDTLNYGVAFAPSRSDLYAAPAFRSIDTAGTVLWGLHEYGGNRIVFSPDGRLAAVGYNGISIVDIATHSVVQLIRDPWAPTVNSFDWSPDGRYLVTVGGEYDTLHLIQLWDVASGKSLRQLHGGSVPLVDVAYARDGGHIYASGDSGLTVWSTSTWSAVDQWKSGRGAYRFLEVSPDGGMLAAGGADTSVDVWDVATGTRSARLHRAGAYPLTGRFTRDGKNFVAGYADGSIVVWDIAAARSTYVYAELPMAIIDLDITDDFRYIATASADGTLAFWRGRGGIASAPEPSVDALALDLEPNPAHDRLELRLVLPAGRAADARIAISDAAGRARSVPVTAIGGDHVMLDVSGLESGVYFCRVECGGIITVRQCVVVR